MDELNNAIEAQETTSEATATQEQEDARTQQEASTEQAQTLDMEQLNAFTSAIIQAQTQRENEIRAQYEAQKQQEQQEQEEPLSDELQFIADKLGISSIKEKYDAMKEENDKLKEALNFIQTQAQQAQIKEQVAELESRIEGFSGKEIYGYLVELNKTNPAMAQALDNPQGWEMIHKSLHGLAQGQAVQGTQQAGQTQPQPDFILSGTQNSRFEPSETMSRIKSGVATYAEMGSIFK